LAFWFANARLEHKAVHFGAAIGLSSTIVNLAGKGPAGNSTTRSVAPWTGERAGGEKTGVKNPCDATAIADQSHLQARK
jgi:hypothetical protein